MKKYFYFFKLIFIVSLLFIQANPLLSEDNKGLPKVLRWAADASSGAPYVFQNPENLDELIGFEVDIIKEIAKELNIKEEFVQNQWDGLIPGLSRKDYDIAINGIEITDDRKQVVNFSEPYYLTYEQIVVRKENTNIKVLSDLSGKKVGTLSGSLAERFLRATKGVIVKTYEDENTSYSDLELRRLDAVLLDQPIAIYYAKWNPQLKLTGQPIGQVSYGIALRKSDTLLLRAINKVIVKIRKNGRLREILEKWNMWNFMMANSLDDHAISNVPHTAYLQYLKTKGTEIDFNGYVKRYISFLPILGKAAVITIVLSIISMILAIVLGLFVALVRIYAPVPFSTLAITFIELIRGTPLLIQLYFIYYAFPNIGIQLSPFLAAIIGLGVNYAAYEAENYRAGIFSVPSGQMEAAISLGMTKFQALKHIILPQAIRVVIPPITNDFISLLKDSSLVSVITMVELTKEYQRLSATYFDYIGTGLLVAAIYLLIGLPFVRLSKMAENKFSPEFKKQKEANDKK